MSARIDCLSRRHNPGMGDDRITALLGYGAAFALLALTACSGKVQSIGDAASGTAGSGGAAQGQGGSKAATGSGGKPGTGAGGTMVTTGGKDSGSHAGSGSAADPSTPPPGPSSCMSGEDCPDNGEPCQTCADGRSICHNGYCDGAGGGTCKVQGGYCPVRCAHDADCPASNLPCTECGNGAQACPITECQAGFCEISYPGCPDYDPCGGKGCGWECQACWGPGCTASVQAFCNNAGKCQPGPPNCGATRCLAPTDCGAPPDCSPCPNGGGACATYGCIGELCVLTCTASGKSCKVSSDCPVPPLEQCVKCVNGECAIPACIDDACQMVCLAAP